MAVTCVSPHLRAGLMRTSPSLRYGSIYTNYLRIQHMNLLFAPLRVGHLLDSYEFAGMKKESCK